MRVAFSFNDALWDAPQTPTKMDCSMLYGLLTQKQRHPSNLKLHFSIHLSAGRCTTREKTRRFCSMQLATEHLVDSIATAAREVYFRDDYNRIIYTNKIIPWEIWSDCELHLISPQPASSVLQITSAVIICSIQIMKLFVNIGVTLRTLPPPPPNPPRAMIPTSVGLQEIWPTAENKQ